jgi:hypothetical protein
MGLYLQRWPTETFYQDSKGQLGFNEYRMWSAEAIGKHGCLVFIHDRWSSGATVDHIFAYLCAKKRGIVPA